MEFPKFLIGDNSDFEDEVFIVHTEFPRFVFAIESEEVLWMDEVDDSSDDEQELSEIVKEAIDFFEAEMEKYEEDED